MNPWSRILDVNSSQLPDTDQTKCAKQSAPSKPKRKAPAC